MEARVLVVEDNPGDAALARTYLEEAHVDVAPTMARAHELLDAGTYDAVLLDMHLPDGAGPQLVGRILQRAPDLPVVVVSGSLREDEGVRASLKQGAQDWLSKEGLTRDRLRRTVIHAIERKKFQQRLVESEERFRQLADNTDLVFWVATSDLDRVVYLNPAFDRLFGTNRERLYDDFSAFHAFIDAQDRPRVLEALRGLAAGTRQLDTRYWITRPDNTRRCIRARGFTVRDPAGRIYRVAGTLEDVTELVASEERVQASADRLSNILEAAGEGIFGVGPDGKVTFANAAAAKLLGYDDIVGMDATHLLAATDGPSAPVLREVLAEGVTRRESLATFRRRDGKHLQVSFVATPKRRNGDIEGAVVVFGDVSELEKAKRTAEEARAKLEETQRFRIQLLNNIAHDMGTPLMVLQLRLDGLAFTDPAPDGSRIIDERTFAAFTAATRQLTTLTRDLRDVSLMEAGAFRLQLRRTDLVGIARETVSELSQIAERSRVRLVTEFPDEPAHVNADGSRIGQALTNLLTNAMKFTPTGGEILVRISTNDGHGVISVADSGPGIPQDAHDRLFRPFSQVHKDTDAKKGTGLGLYITRGIMRAHAGDADLVPSQAGAGATFRLTIPLAAATSAQGGSALPHAMERPGRAP